jgi:hypothetical protein
MTKPKDETSVDIGEIVDASVGEDVGFQGAGAVLPKLKMTFDKDEQETIDTIKFVVEQQVVSEFQPAFMLIKKFINRTRIPQLDGMGNEVMDETGKVQWQRNSDGSIIEDWSKVGAMEMDSLVLNASTFSFFGGQKSIDLYAEAVFAKYMAEDAFDDKFAKILQGTISDKTTAANRNVRMERYFAFYKAYQYKRVKEVLDRLDSLVRRVEQVRMAQLKDTERAFRANRG